MGRRFCEFYPGKAVWQLDWWHLWDRVHNGCRFEPDLEKKIWDLLNAEKLDEAIAILSAYSEVMTSMEAKVREISKSLCDDSALKVNPSIFWSSRKLKELNALITYLDNNRDGIYGVKAYQGKIPGEYLPFGSGPVERLQAVMIAYRMKGQGKHWGMEGAENLAWLLGREWNGKSLEETLDSLHMGLEEWESLNSESGDKAKFRTQRMMGRGAETELQSFKFCPLPSSSLPTVRQGKVNPLYCCLKKMSNMEMLYGIVDFVGERGDAVKIG